MPSRAHQRGGRVVTNVGPGCDGRCNFTRRVSLQRTVKSRGPGAPTLASSFRGASSTEVTVAKKPGHRGEREVSRKPPRRESRRCSGSPVVLPPCFFCCTGPTGAIGTRLSLRPLNSRGSTDDARPGLGMPRECGVALFPCHCERSDAIRTISADEARIASSLRSWQ